MSARNDLRLSYVCLFFGFLNVTLLVPVLPIVAEESGGAGAAGLATAAFFVPAVAAHSFTPALLRRLSARGAVTLGLALLALPCLLQTVAPDNLTLLFAATAVRGIGFGVTTVTAGTLAAHLAAPGRRGAAVGYAGMMAGIPPVFAPALGVLVLDRRGAAVAFALAAAAGLAGAVAASRLSAHDVAAPSDRRLLAAAIAQPLVLWSLLWFGVVSVARGGVLTFAPITLDGGGLSSAASFLACFGTAAYLGRWLSGRAADVVSEQRLLLPGVLVSLVGLVALALDPEGLTVVVAAALLGAGLGSLTTLSQLQILRRARASGLAIATALWNISLDLGFAAGGIVLGLVAARYGYGAAFWSLPGLMIIALVVLLLEAGHQRRRSPGVP